MNLRPLVKSSLILAALVAAPARPESPVVNAVLFYSPTCPHCHRVMTEVMPPIQSRFGDGLRVHYLDVSRPAGGAAFAAAIAQHRIPAERQGVPTLIAGDEVLTGDDEIPERLPALVARLLAAGGAGLPAFLSPGPLAPPAVAAPPPPPPSPPGFPHLPGDPASVAILGLVLAGLVLQLVHAAATWRRRPEVRPGAWRWPTLALVLVSLGVAIYLADAEIRGGHVLCMSDCDVVHASEWAWLFGLVPIGAFGAFGALGLLAAWAAQLHRDERVAAWAGAALLAMALFGVAFSAYLTFLELFVIGAMCEWCVANAVLMGLIGAMQLAPGKRALDRALRRAGPAAMSGA